MKPITNDQKVSEVLKDFKKEVFFAMKDKKISQKKLADGLGISQQAISKKLSGASELSLKDAVMIAIILDLEGAWGCEKY